MVQEAAQATTAAQATGRIIQWYYSTQQMPPVIQGVWCNSAAYPRGPSPV